MQTIVEDIIQETRLWLQTVVIDLNLCPFARRVYENDLIRFYVSKAKTLSDLENDLKTELRLLAEADPGKIDNTLLIHPDVLQEFSAYNDYLDTVDRLIQEEELDGIIQVASFHPDYRFEDTPHNDAANFTNRSPYPMLHLLRESSVTEAVDSYDDINGLTKRNIATLRTLGIDGIRRILKSGKPPSGNS